MSVTSVTNFWGKKMQHDDKKDAFLQNTKKKMQMKQSHSEEKKVFFR